MPPVCDGSPIAWSARSPTSRAVRCSNTAADLEELAVPENLPILGPRIDAFRAALDELEKRLRQAFA